ncbi:MAG TPA: M15 family metallopeptidase [Acidimicrobiales bacterium]|nr:M15 family metallopeptidase [Acidimicrobiales bacterium]
MPNFPNSPRWLCLIAVALTTATIGLSVAPAHAATATTQDPYTERKNVQKQKKIIDAEVSKLKKTDAQLQKELAQLDVSVKATKSAFDVAANAAANAQKAAELARGTEAETTANYTRLKRTTKGLALALYMNGFEEQQAPNLSAEKLAEAAAHGYLNVRALARGDDITTRLGALREEMVRAREAAEAAEAKAAQERSKQQAALSGLQSTKTKQQRAATAVDAALERMLAEAAFLSQRDRALGAEIARRAQGGGGAGGRLTVGNVDVVTVQGITVARSIASKVDALLTNARADGVSLAGWGYRNSQQQIDLRRAHCGSSNYDIYEKPANQCHPPTARPGASMHERGLAIDFTYGGSIITSHSSPAWKWLNENAKTYGLYNLSSEPWHWSTNGN